MAQTAGAPPKKVAAKVRFSSLDVCAKVAALRKACGCGQEGGYRISNIYDINPKTYVIKLSKADSKLLLLVEAGVRIHLTQWARDKGSVPSGFTAKLRKHLKSRRLEKVEQLGTDRVVILTCGSGPAEHKLIIELYDRGNIVLTDHQNQASAPDAAS